MVVQGSNDRRRVDVPLKRRVGDLRDGMDTCVRAAGASDRDGLSIEERERPFEQFLNRCAGGLALPPDERGAVVRDRQLEGRTNRWSPGISRDDRTRSRLHDRLTPGAKRTRIRFVGWQVHLEQSMKRDGQFGPSTAPVDD